MPFPNPSNIDPLDDMGLVARKIDINKIKFFRFAVMEEKVTLASVLRNFNLKVKF